MMSEWKIGLLIFFSLLIRESSPLLILLEGELPDSLAGEREAEVLLLDGEEDEEEEEGVAGGW